MGDSTEEDCCELLLTLAAVLERVSSAAEVRAAILQTLVFVD